MFDPDLVRILGIFFVALSVVGGFVIGKNLLEDWRESND